jgi:hypothetical protein
VFMSLQKILETKEWIARIIQNLVKWNLYVAYKDYQWMMDTTEDLLRIFAEKSHGSESVVFG